MKFWLLFALLIPLCAVAQDPNRGTMNRATATINVDGVLDEADWQQAPLLGEILQREPKQGVAATEKTEVKLLFDKDSFYVGVTCYDSEPGKIVATQMARDAVLLSDDSIEILLDPYRDRRNAFYFATNPLGVRVDGLIIENGTPNRDWDAIWNVKAKRFAGGWTAEFAIPFKSLSFKKNQGVWGFNLPARFAAKSKKIAGRRRGLMCCFIRSQRPAKSKGSWTLSKDAALIFAPTSHPNSRTTEPPETMS